MYPIYYIPRLLDWQAIVSCLLYLSAIRLSTVLFVLNTRENTFPVRRVGLWALLGCFLALAIRPDVSLRIVTAGNEPRLAIFITRWRWMILITSLPPALIKFERISNCERGFVLGAFNLLDVASREIAMEVSRLHIILVAEREVDGIFNFVLASFLLYLLRAG